jgi:Bacterial pre-peptidase C-terminal domain
MDKQRTIRRTVLAMALAALGATGTALADGSFAEPQRLAISGGSITIAGAINSASPSEPEVDYYAFEAQAGDVITIDIDGTTGGLDAVLHLFGPNGEVAFESMETDPIDAGSNPPADCLDCMASPDPQLLNIPITESGTWILAVSSEPAYLTDQGRWAIIPPLAGNNGSYTLTISGVSATPTTPPPAPANPQVSIDIKPRQAGPATIHPNSRGAIPVVLLSDNNFDPFTVDPASLRFGRTGGEFSYRLCGKEGWDLNRDGKPDRLCFFDTQKAGFKPGDTIGVLKGISGGRWFEGKGDLKVVGEKRARYERERNKKHNRDRRDRDDRHDRQGRHDRDD